MSSRNYRILLIEPDHNTGNFLHKQVLYPLGYQVDKVDSVTDAMDEIARDSPDLIIANLSLPDLSGKDLLVALTSQGIDVPVIVMAKKGVENNVIQALRLGASDYLSLPLREIEVATVIERVLDQRNDQQKREKLISELKQSNQDLQHKLRGTTAALAILKTTALVTDLKSLYERILESALLATSTQRGWILMREGHNNQFVLVSYLSTANGDSSQDLPWEDFSNPLDAITDESQSDDKGKPHVFKFKSTDGSTLIAPVQSYNTLIGFLIVMRCNPDPFSSFELSLLEAISHHAACSITKLRLFQSVYKPAYIHKK
jgi:DNA-binding response OmpR family regulator